jgi:transposase
MPMPRAYPSDLTNSQWAAVEPMILDAAPGGCPRRAPKREIVEAIAVSAARRLFMAASSA